LFILPIPTDDEFRTWRRRAPVVWSLVLLNVLAFLLTLQHPAPFVSRYAFVPASPSAVTAGASMFMHAGWMHILGNMFFLIIFGRPVEHAVGSIKFALCYIVAGLAALAVHAAVTPAPTLPVVGASGAISGVVGMFLALFPNAPVDLHAYFFYWRVRTWRSTGLMATGIWFAEQVVLGLLNSTLGVFPGIAFWAHVGGLVCGVVLGVLAGRLTLG